ncbi:MAG: DUF4255 domain-containing protein [Myxococcales bacterium]|nr:DUF4255 domain-containing protein [Myxococcales bacterium]
MAGFAAIASVGASVTRLLNAHFVAEQPISGKKTTAVLVRTEDFDKTGPTIVAPALSIYLYRVDYNKTMRASWSAVGHADGRGHLVLDLHYLLTPWADNAEHEHRILGKTMQCLEATPVLTGPLLIATTEWADNESVQLCMDEITTEALMRTFDSLPLDYKLSVPYVARVVRIDTKKMADYPPVVTVATGTTTTVEADP